MSDGLNITPVLAAGSNAALYTFLAYTLAVFGLAAMSNQLLKSKSFMSEYFLGSRSLGVWAFALTFAATSASGGSFTGFPSKIYSHGWTLALWIGSYMVVPICAMGLLGKRINQVARISGSITVPDVLRDRFHSAAFGILATLLIVFFMTFNLVAQFKAGATILTTLLSDVELYHNATASVNAMTAGVPFLAAVDPGYLICLFAFGVAVIIYTTYGGFHAVVWTDVMQGVVMVIGVMIMLPLAIWQAGGMQHATEEMAKMTPPRIGTVTLQLSEPQQDSFVLQAQTWLKAPGEDQQERLFRVAKNTSIPPGGTQVQEVDVVEITTPEEIARIKGQLERDPLTDQLPVEYQLTEIDVSEFEYGAGKQGVYVVGPGPHKSNSNGFLPLSLAISFFFMWAISGAGQPSSMVRLMAFNSSTTLRRSIFTVTLYFSFIYFPLVVIFCCARILLPGMDSTTDRIMPEMAILLTKNVGMLWLAGLLVAAPFAAVMSTVDSFLLMISSAVVRDIYQRNINPKASEKTVKLLSYACTFVVGSGAMLGALNPPQYLQDIIVYTGGGLAACFLGPMVFTLYWPRANAPGVISGMLAGFVAHLSMYVAGIFMFEDFFQNVRPYQLFDFDPVVIGLFVSFIAVYVVTLMTPPPPAELVDRYFRKKYLHNTSAEE
ncbi:Sodium/pantothenate symporter [Symmachiella dynata]|uniref:sodium:solute symporter family transporter n=1 Tax=Symmachiella dynata TaxID=2527995 RepID=UPI001189FF9D|nr:hypothetical protein [Symmachiella dynata]QDT51100.1 Sodium/pantothenate symporter [Symmachiella dynata]